MKFQIALVAAAVAALSATPMIGSAADAPAASPPAATAPADSGDKPAVHKKHHRHHKAKGSESEAGKTK